MTAVVPPLTLTAPPFPALQTSDTLADWLELSSLARTTQVSAAFLEQTLNRAGVRRPRPRVDDTWRALMSRQDLLGGAWPFRFQQGQSLLSPVDSHPHGVLNAFFAALSLGESIENTHRKHFEYVVGDIVRALSGNHSLVVGDPRPGRVAGKRGINKSLDEIIDHYAILSGERRRDPFPAADNDLGLDIITWRQFHDGRRGAYLHFFGQCATGHDWYQEKKASDFNLDVWSDHFQWAVTPVRFLAIPFYGPPNPTNYRRAARRGGLLLDRARLLELAAASPPRPRNAWRAREYLRTLYSPTDPPTGSATIRLP